MEFTFSPQIHQKYIYMWNDPHRSSTEHWQKTSDFQKGKKIPTYLGRAKEKRIKKETKESGWDLHLWEGAVKEAKFPHTRKPPHWQGQWGTSEPQRRVQQQVCGGQSRESPAQRVSADWHSPA